MPSCALGARPHVGHGLAHVVGQRAAVGVAEHERLGARLLGRGQDGQREVGVAPVAVEEVLRIEEDAQVVLPQVAHRVGHHGHGLVERGAQRLGDVAVPRLGHDAGDGRPGLDQVGQDGVVSGLTPARRVEPNATSVAVPRVSSFLARAKNSTSLGLAPGQPPSMKVTPRWSSCSATRSLSSTVRERPSCWLPSRRMVSKMSTASGRSGTAKSWACALCPCACVWRVPRVAVARRRRQSTWSSHSLYWSTSPRTVAK